MPIGNPLSAQFSVLRPSLLPGLLAAVAHNRNRERADVRLFELGATVTRAGESRRVAVALDRRRRRLALERRRRDVDFFDVKGLVERSARRCRSSSTFDAASIPPYLVRGRAATVAAGGRAVGRVGMLAPAIAASAGLSPNEDVYVAELDLDALTRVAAARR